MQRQQPNIRVEISDGAIAENARSQQQPDSPSLTRIPRRSSLRNKIGFGYALALGIAIAGTSTGLVVGNYHYQQARKQGMHIDEETRRLSEVHQSLTHAKVHALQIIATNLTPAQLQQQYQEVVEHQQQLKSVWAEIRAEADTEVLPELKGFLNEYGGTIEAYAQRFGEILAEIKSPVEETEV